MDNAALAHSIFDAAEAGDIQKFLSCFTSDAVIWHNYDQIDQPVAAAVAQLGEVMKMVKSIKYADRRYVALPDGAVLQHTSVAELPNGHTMSVYHMLRLYIDGDKVRRVEEYIDSRQMGQ
jgi:ketosteroid isomerase-like protein